MRGDREIKKGEKHRESQLCIWRVCKIVATATAVGYIEERACRGSN